MRRAGRRRGVAAGGGRPVPGVRRKGRSPVLNVPVTWLVVLLVVLIVLRLSRLVASIAVVVIILLLTVHLGWLPSVSR
jgi:hypothetical protein